MEMELRVIVGAALLMAVDGGLYFWGRRVTASAQAEARYGTPMTEALLVCMLAALIHFTGMVFAWKLFDAFVAAFLGSVITGWAPAMLFMRYQSEAYRSSLDQMLLGFPVTKVSVDMPKARRRLRDNDVEGAQAAYREYAKDYPDSPDPLFGIAFLLGQESRFNEEAAICREIADRFDHELAIWTKASVEHAKLLHGKLNDRRGARLILKKVRERNPEFRFGILTARKAPAKKRRDGSPREVKMDPHELAQARRLSKSEETDAAVALFRRHFQEHPHEPKPLFEAAMALERVGRYEEALAPLQEVIRHFPYSDHWGEAAMRLASLQEAHLGDRESAIGILREIKNHFPRTERGRRAAERLEGLEESD